MITKRLGVGVLGIAWVSHPHIDAWPKRGYCDVVALCSHSEDNAWNAVAQHGLKDCQVYTDYAQMLQQENVNVVDICSRNASHAAQGIAAKAGKHVLMDKPVAMTLEELRRLARAITTAGVKSLAGFVLHWSRYLDIVTSMIVRDFFGTLYFGDTGYISGRRPPVVRRIRLGQDIFTPCIVHDHTPPLAITDAVKAHEIIVAAEQSALDGKPVKLLLPSV